MSDAHLTARRVSRHRSAGLAVLTVMALVAAVLSGGRAAAADSVPWPTNADWQQYVEGPAAPNVTPAAVMSTSGNVTNAAALVSGGSGSAKLTMVSGGTAPVIILDYGKDVGGFPYFTVTAESGGPVLRAAYSEGQQFIGANGDGGAAFNAGDKSRADSYTVKAAGAITNRYIQGGERFEEIRLTSAGSVTLSAVGIQYSAYRATANDYQGYFVSSSDQLNKIWYAGAYTTRSFPRECFRGTSRRPAQVSIRGNTAATGHGTATGQAVQRAGSRDKTAGVTTPRMG